MNLKIKNEPECQDHAYTQLLCRFQDHYDVMEVKFMVDCTNMKVYHKTNFSSAAQNNLLLAVRSNISSSFSPYSIIILFPTPN